MFRKTCPVCGKNSYSAYEGGEWVCPHCGKDISRWSDLRDFVKGKTVEGITVSEDEGNIEGFDINFTDGSTLELYVIDGHLFFTMCN